MSHMTLFIDTDQVKKYFGMNWYVNDCKLQIL